MSLGWVIAFMALSVAITAPFMFYCGRVAEWELVLRYVHTHEDKPAWWLAAGITADEHRKLMRRKS